MAEQLKLIYNKKFVEALAALLKEHYPALNEKQFSAFIFDKYWEGKELKQRMRHIATAMHECLPKNFSIATAILVKCIKKIGRDEKLGMNFGYMLFPDYIEQYGLDDVEVSIKAFEEITKVTSAEFGVRPFLIKYPARMQKQMLLWSKHKHPMVRRLSCEGFRPRLPWGMDVPYLKKDPLSILPILENLKQDENEIVRRSVSNNLNDISKEHPIVVLKIAKDWSGISAETDKIIRHGCRTLLKRGNVEALRIYGLKDSNAYSILDLTIVKQKIKLGEQLCFKFNLFVNKETKIRLEYGIDYMKSNGKQSRKIFKLSEGNFSKGEFQMEKKQAFKDFTTRKHYSGKHGLAIIVNGVEKASASFSLQSTN